MSAPTLPGEVEQLMRQLRLPMPARAGEVLATARAQRWDPAEVVKALLTEEARTTRTCARPAETQSASPKPCTDRGSKP